MGHPSLLALICTSLSIVRAQYSVNTSAQPNTFAVIGDTGVSAQQLFYSSGKVYIVDKVSAERRRQSPPDRPSLTDHLRYDFPD